MIRSLHVARAFIRVVARKVADVLSSMAEEARNRAGADYDVQLEIALTNEQLRHEFERLVADAWPYMGPPAPGAKTITICGPWEGNEPSTAEYPRELVSDFKRSIRTALGRVAATNAAMPFKAIGAPCVITDLDYIPPRYTWEMEAEPVDGLDDEDAPPSSVEA